MERKQPLIIVAGADMARFLPATGPAKAWRPGRVEATPPKA